MYNFKPILENRKKIKKNKKDLDTVELMMGIEEIDGKFKRKGPIPEDLKEVSAVVEYELDGDVAKMKVEQAS
tara:strand:- start:526 stop:741 length:216 start_codon:yes stop_codon:yes gene_type:complete